MDGAYRRALHQLLALTSDYCVALALYRENVDAHFVYKLHRDKAMHLVRYLGMYLDLLPEHARITLGFCKQHVDG